MSESTNEILNPRYEHNRDPLFPNAPLMWTKGEAIDRAKSNGITLRDDHWELVRALQEYCSEHTQVNIRELHDVLEEKFYARGGIKLLYKLFPGGPIVQGCAIAGLQVPAGSRDLSFGGVRQA